MTVSPTIPELRVQLALHISLVEQSSVRCQPSAGGQRNKHRMPEQRHVAMSAAAMRCHDPW